MTGVKTIEIPASIICSHLAQPKANVDENKAETKLGMMQTSNRHPCNHSLPFSKLNSLLNYQIHPEKSFQM
jgi:hypothetical protein